MPTPANIVLANRRVSKPLSIQKVLPTSGGVYGDTFVYDLQQPEDTREFRILYLDDAEVATYQSALDTPGAQVTITDDAGASFTGTLTDFSIQRLAGSDLFEVGLTLRKNV